MTFQQCGAITPSRAFQGLQQGWNNPSDWPKGGARRCTGGRGWWYGRTHCRPREAGRIWVRICSASPCRRRSITWTCCTLLQCPGWECLTPMGCWTPCDTLRTHPATQQAERSFTLLGQACSLVVDLQVFWVMLCCSDPGDHGIQFPVDRLDVHVTTMVLLTCTLHCIQIRSAGRCLRWWAVRSAEGTGWSPWLSVHAWGCLLWMQTSWDELSQNSRCPPPSHHCSPCLCMHAPATSHLELLKSPSFSKSCQAVRHVSFHNLNEVWEGADGAGLGCRADDDKRYLWAQPDAGSAGRWEGQRRHGAAVCIPPVAGATVATCKSMWPNAFLFGIVLLQSACYLANTVKRFVAAHSRCGSKLSHVSGEHLQNASGRCLLRGDVIDKEVLSSGYQPSKPQEWSLISSK